MLVLPFTCAMKLATAKGGFDSSIFVNIYGKAINPTLSIKYIISRGLVGDFLGNLSNSIGILDNFLTTSIILTL